MPLDAGTMRDEAERARELERRLDAEIAEAIAEGADDKRVLELRRRRSNARLNAEDRERAAELVDRRALEESERRALEARAEAAREATPAAVAVRDAAARVDAAMAELASAEADLRARILDLSRLLRTAGLDDRGEAQRRLGTRADAGLRYSIFHHGAGLASAMQVAHVPGHRRAPLAETLPVPDPLDLAARAGLPVDAKEQKA